MRGAFAVKSITTMYFIQLALGQVQTPRENGLDIFLCLDNSGSMHDNDPNFRLRDAVDSFVRRLPSSARVGIVTFDDSGRVVLGLTDLANPNFSSTVTNRLNALNYKGQYTDIPGGFQTALYSLRESGLPKAKKVIVLVTDGVVDLPDKTQISERKKWLQEGQLQEALNLHIRIFGIAFTRTADLQLIQSLSIATGGTYKNPAQASDLKPAFEDIYKAIISPEAANSKDKSTSELGKDGKRKRDDGHPIWQVALAICLGLIVFISIINLLAKRTNYSQGSVAIPKEERAVLVNALADQERVFIDRTPFRIGRGSLSDLRLKEDEYISQPHAAIEFRNGSYYIRDLRSTNGTWLDMVQPPGSKDDSSNARRISPSADEPLKHNDIIRFGRHKVFRFQTLNGGGTVLQGVTFHMPTACRFHTDRPVTELCESCGLPLCQECASDHRCSA